MFNSKEIKKGSQIKADVIETIVGLNTEIEGSIISQGSLRVDGILKGDVSIKGNLIIGDKGSLEGGVTANNVVVAGQIIGNVTALEKIEINKTGKVVGDIFSKFVVIEEGSEFTGYCKMEKTNEKPPLLTEKTKSKKN